MSYGKCMLCEKKGSFGLPEKKKEKYCKDHKNPLMVDLTHRKCLECNKRPSYNYPGEKGAMYCVLHKKESMCNVVSAKCTHPSCSTIAIYGVPGTKKALYCKAHKTEESIDVKHDGSSCHCGKRATYNYPDERRGIRCKQHKDPEMIDVMNRACLVCGKQSNFGFPGEGKGSHCFTHKLDNMVDLYRVNCVVCNKVQGSYNYPGEKKRSYCSKDKLPGMVKIFKPSCQLCDITASFGYKGGKVEYCTTHKLKDMVDLTKKKCFCGTIASYGRLFSKKTHCAKHKKDNEFTKNHPRCEECEQERAYYVDDNSNYPKRCETCKLPGDKNIVEKPCASCGLPEFLNQDNSLCSMCFSYSTQVNKPERKELVIKKFLEKNGISVESHDAIIDGACSRKRPDFILDYGLFKVCLEIDEHQHKGYPEECELSRMGAIHQDLGGIDVLFIRFNPDCYKHQGKTIREYKSREKFLLDYLTNLNNVQKLVCPLLVTYFYYDNFSKPEYIYYDYYTRKSEEVEFPFHKIRD
ncbi:hypothetical protein BQ9231_00161 [Cedratvirus lausannensis]|uniref:Endonuclease n=1 Tax=Cedratvirus lausannensis TaxID=2023205 RepID=A0A285PWP7_9VIRU|nr:hypothetical protein BQ9231_00161 [Cedratvirus lausannensis]